VDESSEVQEMGNKKGLVMIGVWWLITIFFIPTGGDAMEITSSAFANKGTIPIKYVMPGAGGKNVSLPLSWSAVPAGTKSFALAIVDPHPVANHWVHWLVINMPLDTSGLGEGASGSSMPAGAVELKNSFGEPGYGGPQPPKGSGDHPYVVTLYALNEARLELPVQASLAAFKKALEGKILATSTVTGMFGR
jgi:Raf kinase inhibitor-like YbhB/YbcL family protein